MFLKLFSGTLLKTIAPNCTKTGRRQKAFILIMVVIHSQSFNIGQQSIRRLVATRAAALLSDGRCIRSRQAFSQYRPSPTR